MNLGMNATNPARICMSCLLSTVGIISYLTNMQYVHHSFLINDGFDIACAVVINET